MQPQANCAAKSGLNGRQREAADKIFSFRAEAGDDDAANERDESEYG